MATFAPTDPSSLADVLAQAVADRRTVELRGGGSKSRMGADRDCDIIDMRGFAGVVDYDPAELVLTVGAGTPLEAVRALVAGQGQMLAFDPLDPGRLTGAVDRGSTIGGAVVGGFSGPMRLTGGDARDHLLGFAAVSGRGEAFRAGAKVVKNVTGYDLSKLVAGSWGRLVAVHELTLKVLPRPRMQRTLVLYGLSVAQAYAAMAQALGSRCEVTAAAHLPGRDATLFLLAGFGPSVEARALMLRDMLVAFGTPVSLEEAEAEAEAGWADVRGVIPLKRAPTLWRIVIPASTGPTLIAALEPLGAQWLSDWAGGLIWLALDGQAEAVRAAAQSAGGHAMLLRAPDHVRATVPAWHPVAPTVARIETRVRRAFDPVGIFETGRYLDQWHAD